MHPSPSARKEYKWPATHQHLALTKSQMTVVALWEDEKASTNNRLKLLQPTPVTLMHAWHLNENHGRNMQAGRGSEEEGQPEPAWDRSGLFISRKLLGNRTVALSLLFSN
jgi:hypothetical protein